MSRLVAIGQSRAIGCLTLIFLTMLVLVFSAGPLFAAERGTVLEERRMHSRVLGKDVQYSIYLPPEYDEGNRRFPVLYMMHGGWDGRDEDWFRYGEAARLLDRMIEAGEMPPVVAVSVDGRRHENADHDTYYMNDADGAYRWEDMFVGEFVEHVETAYRVRDNKRGRAVLGLSMGGHAASALAIKFPELFAGSAVLSGSFRTEDDIVSMDQAGYDRRYGRAWGVGLSGRARLTDEYRENDVLQLAAKVPAEEIASVQHYFDCGSEDPFFRGNADLHMMLLERGVAHRFMIREGGHDWDYWRSSLPGALAFLADVLRR
ncbi:alpha/beta hydrolase-fold protein [Fulvimarina sp. MAC3]|uniref:alpha/beta hydrolase n=1 Tax=Fulvimarina sp. MAC3 TaxID=3148887 RepID=UPI0031FCC492